MYRLGDPRAPVLGSHNLLKYRKYSALLSGFISNYYLAGFKELLEKKKRSTSVGVQTRNRSFIFTVILSFKKTASNTSQKMIAWEVGD